MTAHRGKRPLRRSWKRRVRRSFYRKLNCMIAWCSFLLQRIVSCVSTCLASLSMWLFTSQATCAADCKLPLHMAKPRGRPCLPDMSGVDVLTLSEKELVDRIVGALYTWGDQVHMPPHVWDTLASQFSDRLSLSENSAVSQCVLRCCIICVVACGDPSLAKVLSHQLGLVTRAMVAWMLPHDMKT